MTLQLFSIDAFTSNLAFLSLVHLYISCLLPSTFYYYSINIVSITIFTPRSIYFTFFPHCSLLNSCSTYTTPSTLAYLNHVQPFLHIFGSMFSTLDFCSRAAVYLLSFVRRVSTINLTKTVGHITTSFVNIY